LDDTPRSFRGGFARRFLLLRHNSREMVRIRPNPSLANVFPHLAQWTQLLARPEKVPMADAEPFVSCQFYPLEERLHE
jgi:hypothetical protein